MIPPERRTAAPSAAQPRIAYWVGRLERALRRRLATAVGRSGLTVAQFTALSVLQGRGPLSNAQLARRSLVSPQAMNEIIKALGARRLVMRRADPLHGRIVLMSLTQKGASLLRRCDRAVQRAEEGMLGPLSAAESAHFHALLRECAVRLEGERARA
ncbi:MAG TPA: MarR family transcriptional regulator [Steroidobacteraceae bacterium]|nr:MarR family transcriptional regulator [Steroidobacteraceae bacterium]